jgi:hypothetical protein
MYLCGEQSTSHDALAREFEIAAGLLRARLRADPQAELAGSRFDVRVSAA